MFVNLENGTNHLSDVLQLLRNQLKKISMIQTLQPVLSWVATTNHQVLLNLFSLQTGILYGGKIVAEFNTNFTQLANHAWRMTCTTWQTEMTESEAFRSTAVHPETNVYARDSVNPSNGAVQIKFPHELYSFVPNTVQEELPHRLTVEKKIVTTTQWISQTGRTV